MKRQYLQSLPKPTEIKNQAYNTYLTSVQALFNDIRQAYSMEKSEHLWEQLKKLNGVRSIKKGDKRPIYEYFVKNELQTLNYIRGVHSIDFEIMKLTKCRMDDFRVDWKELWERILKEVPETSGTNSKPVEIFLKHIRNFFNPDNAIQVLDYFQRKNYKDINKVITIFVRISEETKQQIFHQYVNQLISKCKIGEIQKYQFLNDFLRLEKCRKHICLPEDVFEFVNDLVLQFILASDQKSMKKGTFENNFNSTSAELLEKILGKANSGSIRLLNIIFSFVKKFIKPLENSTKSTMFIYWFFKFIFARVQTEQRTKQRLQKLCEKIKLKKQEQQKQKLESSQEPQTQQNEQKQNQNQKNKQKDDSDNDDEEDEEEDEEQQDEQQLLLLTQNNKLTFEKDDEQKWDTDEEKKQKMEKLLANEITPQILAYLEKQIEELFEVLYYVNSKKTISHLLRYIYRLFPKFAVKSLDVLNKAANIPSINEDGLVKNLTVTVQHMFMEENYKGGVKNTLRVLEKAFNSRRIIDVWPIYESVGAKLPLLDEKDLEKVSEEDKQQFEKTFQINHDRFYSDYSDHMLEAFKKLLKQGEYLQKNQHKQYSTTMSQIYYNSYPTMRKRILQAVMEVLEEQPNSLALSYFTVAELPARQYQIIKNQFLEMGEQNRDTEDLRIHFLQILAKKMPLQQLKPHLIKMAQKGHFQFIQQYAIFRISEEIKWSPYKTTLNYFYEDPQITIEFVNNLESRKKCLKELQKLRNQLIQEVIQVIDIIKQDENDSVSNRIIKSYTTPAKILTLAQRKKIHEILTIVDMINFMMEEKIISIKNSKRLQLISSEVSPYGFLHNTPFSKYIKKLLNSQEVLHDPKLISTLNKMLTTEYFMYYDIESNERKKLDKERKRNKNHEPTGCANRIIYGNQYISLARRYMGALLHKTKGGNNLCIKDKSDELFILSMVNSNQSYKDLRSMFQQSNMIQEYRNYLFDLMNHRVENRELLKRISSTVDFLTKREVSYLVYTDQQILDFVDSHAALMQSQDSKVKQNALKSFRKFSKLIEDNPISDTLTESMLKYRKMDKMQMIWMVFVISVINHHNFQKDKDVAEKKIMYFIKHLEGLVLNQSRSTRRISLYIYPALIRILKKLNVKFQTKTYEKVQIQEKSLQQFIQTGYIRPQFYNKDLKDKSIQKKHPQNEYELKLPYRIPEGLFDFLINNPENALKFIKNFHSDLASTSEMMLSAIQTAANTVDLFSIASKSVEKIIYFFKAKDMNISRTELIVGAKFFKYLCLEDAFAGYKFFGVVKDFVIGCLSNLESLDNQTLVILYSHSLINAYETTFIQRNAEIEGFLTQIIQQIIKKSSKLIFYKLQTIFFKKIKNREAIKFIEELCEKMVAENKKIYRAGYLQTIISGKNYSSTQNLLRKMFDHKIQLEHQNNVTNTVNYLLSYPKLSAWNINEVERTKVINFNKLRQENKIIELPGQHIMFSNKQLKDYILKSISQMLEGESTEMVKTGFTILNNTLKSVSDISISNESAQFVNQLIKIELKMQKEKKQLQLDFDSANKAIAQVLNCNLLPKELFEKFLVNILDNIEPSKKSCDLLNEILNSPLNYIYISSEVCIKFATKLLDFEVSSALYKQLLKILSTFLRYRLDIFEKLSQAQKGNKNRRTLLFQAYLLSENADLNPKYVNQVLKNSGKDRKNIWARQMLLIRGQREYFDKEQTYEVWREIKQLSNPYHYHA